MKKNLTLMLVVLGSIGLLATLYLASSFNNAQRVFSDYSLLRSTWEKYKQRFIQTDGRVIDYSQNSKTTSEGQSYSLLRAVWSDDRETFDLVWNWTQNNLKRPTDNLYGWQWGQRTDGSYGLIDESSQNFATDADMDIALALIFASSKWGDAQYAEAAQKILDDVWRLSTEEVQGKRYLLPGNWANTTSEIILNPSYFMPYSWRIFGQFDPKHDWNSLIDPAYEVLRQVGTTPLSNQDGRGLPPNWVVLSKTTGQLSTPPQEKLSTEYGYDAIRVPWRIAVDYTWFGQEQALNYLRTLGVLEEKYRQDGKLFSTYTHGAAPATDYESPAMYATALGYFMYVYPEIGEEIYKNRILSLYSNDTNSFASELGYYDENWLWFSAALYTKSLPNLYKGGS